MKQAVLIFTSATTDQLRGVGRFNKIEKKRLRVQHYRLYLGTAQELSTIRKHSDQNYHSIILPWFVYQRSKRLSESSFKWMISHFPLIWLCDAKEIMRTKLKHAFLFYILFSVWQLDQKKKSLVCSIFYAWNTFLQNVKYTRE